MRLAVLAFALGVVALQWSATLPEAWLLALVAAGGGVVLLAVWRWRRLLPVAALLLGFAWAGGWAQWRLADALPAASEGRDIEVTGVVASLPQRFDRGLRFRFDVESSSMPVPSHISLSWYGGWRPQEDDDPHVMQAVRPGERWRLTVRLKRPHGNLNPHGFDFEAWLFEQGIRATGYVRARGDNVRLEEWVASPGALVERLRGQVRDRFGRVLGDAPYAGVLVALAIGDQQAIPAPLWQTFARTGVTHLLSVSGLHVTMVAGLAAWLAGWGWRRSSWLMLRLPAQKAAALAGFLAALAYCLLAGFAVPAQRTLYMLSVVALALWSGRTTGGSRVLALALLVVLLLDPWAVLAPGFWLSFGAVALLFSIAAGRLGTSHWLAAWARAQWAVTLGMVPALLALFQQFSLVSPLANAVAIPVVSLLVTPLVLFGALPLGDLLLWLAHWLTSVLMDLLVVLSSSPWAVWQQAAPPAWAVAFGVCGVAWLLLPRGFPARGLGAVMLLPLVLVSPPRPAEGEAKMTVFDVGQGLAVHVQTAGHDLLYDAGPAFSPDSNSGNRIIVPSLRAMGVGRLDAMVVSHEDKDHEGGAQAVAEALPVARLVSGLPPDHVLAAMLPHQPCRDGDAWTWDGVRFEMLHPPEGMAPGGNRGSCVLKVTTAGGAALLTGDIDAGTEAELLARHGDAVAADVVVPPHHGSRNSSGEAFVKAAAPRLTVFSAGYRNRFAHPAPEVVARYAGIGSDIVRTDRAGAVIVRLGRTGLGVATAAEEQRRYWRER